jgi:hypothetical protein
MMKIYTKQDVTLLVALRSLECSCCVEKDQKFPQYKGYVQSRLERSDDIRSKNVKARNRACERPSIERQPSESEAPALTSLFAMQKELGECPFNSS